MGASPPRSHTTSRPAPSVPGMTDTTPSTRVRRRELLAAGGGLAAGLLRPRVARLGRRRRSCAPARCSRTACRAATSRSRSGVVWARADRPGRMSSRSPTPASRQRGGSRARCSRPDTDFTGQGPPARPAAGRARCLYRVRLEDLRRPRADAREPLTATFRTAPTRRARRLVRRGAATSPARAGASTRTSAATASSVRWRGLDPDFFLYSGDTSTPTVRSRRRSTLPDGRIWRNLVTPEKSKVAETLAEFRGQFRYNLLDENLRALRRRRCPQVNQWDDHEVRNNWYPGEILDDARYTEKRVDVLAARARRAFLEYLPIRRRAADRDGPRLPHDRLRPAAGRLRPRHAHLPRPQLAERPRRPAPRPPRRRAARVAQARAARLAGDVEGDRHRPARSASSSRTADARIEARRQGDPARRSAASCEIAELLRHAQAGAASTGTSCG